MEKHEKDSNFIIYIKKQFGGVLKTFLPPLSQNEELECLNRLKENDLDARNELILHNMRLVAHVTKKYVGADEEQEELISIGTVGLIKAVSSFNVDYGSKFSTYAIRCIDNEILMYFRSKKKCKNDVSLYEPIGMDKEGNQIHLMDVIENTDMGIYEKVQQNNYISKLEKNIKNILSEREYEIICKRYGLVDGNEYTQKEIAGKLGISRSYVSRIEKKALQKLKKYL